MDLSGLSCTGALDDRKNVSIRAATSGTVHVVNRVMQENMGISDKRNLPCFLRG